MIRVSKQIRQVTILHLRFCPIQVKIQWCRARLLKVEFHTRALTMEKGDEALSPAVSNLFFQGNENEIQKDVYPRSAKEDDNHSNVSGSTHDEDQKYWL